VSKYKKGANIPTGVTEFQFKIADLNFHSTTTNGLWSEVLVLSIKALEAKGIKDGDKGFRLIFSAGEFPLYDFKFSWLREGDGGNWYFSDDFNIEGWLCPALFAYFDEAPKEIYTKFEPKSDK